MIIGFILGVVGVVLGIIGSVFGLLINLVGSVAIGVLMLMLLIGAVLFSPVLLWFALAIAAVCLIRCGRWLERALRS